MRADPQLREVGSRIVGCIDRNSNRLPANIGGVAPEGCQKRHRLVHLEVVDRRSLDVRQCSLGHGKGSV